ncbi:hypothetical protein CDAR_225901 [Caerostris darwini]|uniref:Ycf15 n=1 Tax=Caerostris darwini TaxID=1538125 RepID=A0AAV4M2T2_9ARAC|nr:hypothetical protein CDAR_225901 [Caerostris darwini]
MIAREEKKKKHASVTLSSGEDQYLDWLRFEIFFSKQDIFLAFFFFSEKKTEAVIKTAGARKQSPMPGGKKKKKENRLFDFVILHLAHPSEPRTNRSFGST